jgi:hypothetical protein
VGKSDWNALDKSASCAWSRKSDNKCVWLSSSLAIGHEMSQED